MGSVMPMPAPAKAAPEKFTFTELRLARLPQPVARAKYVYDSDEPGLCVRLTRGGKTITLKKETGVWKSLEKPEALLNTETVNDTLAALAGLKLERYAVDKGADKKLFGLDPPELVIEAEAGMRREAVGRRIALGEGLIGQVARTGQMGIVREASASTPCLVLGGSAAGVALPVSYGEQFLGVLYIEAAEPCDFPQQDVVLLRTLADLFAGALHNALTFQKAQEQAITDGLTGVKTHRFLMEALSSEWKRSTRANRPLALVLMDLDHFKFVNDFYGHLEGDVVLQRVGHIL